MDGEKMEVGLNDSIPEDLSDSEDCDEPEERYLPDIENEEDFQEAWEYFKQMTSKDLYLDINDYHLALWSKLMEHVKMKENWKDMIVMITTHAIQTCPLTSNPKEVTWKKYVIFIYTKINEGELSLEDATSALQEADIKFGLRPQTARAYFKIVSYHEEKLKEDLNWSAEFYFSRVITRYMLQFDHPYVGAEMDWVAFEKMRDLFGEEIYTQIKTLYINNLESSSWQTKKYSALEDSYYQSHHLDVATWINHLLDSSPTSCQADLFALDWVRREPKSICFYYIYLNAMSRHPKFVDSSDKKLWIFHVAKLALKHGVSCCNQTILPRMIQGIIVIAIFNLNDGQIKELVNILLSFKMDKDLVRWHAARTSVLFAVKHLILNNVLKKEELKMYFLKCLKPADLTFAFHDDTNSFDIQKQNMIIDLTMDYVKYEEVINKLSWPETMAILKECLLRTCEPHPLYSYVEFIRSRGSSVDAKAAYEEVLGIIENRDMKTFHTRKCQQQLMANYIELLTTLGEYDKAMKYNDLLIKCHFEGLYEYNEDHTLRISQFSLDDDTSVKETMQSQSLACQDGSMGNLLTHQISSLTVNPAEEKKSTQANTSETIEDMESFDNVNAIFLSNMSYKATEEHIREAFAKHNLTVRGVKMETKRNGLNYGYGIVIFNSKKDSQMAINQLDGIEINGRKTFVSVCREKSVKRNAPEKSTKRSVQEHSVKRNFDKTDVPQATVLFLSELPKEWQDPNWLRDTLGPYGHIKDVTVDDNEPVVARVEFHFPSDAENAYDQAKDGSLFQGNSIKLRLGYASKKRPHPDIRKGISKSKHSKIGKVVSVEQSTTDKVDSDSKTDKPSTQEVNSKNGEPKSKVLKSRVAPRVGNLFIPHMLQRNVQKRKLEVGNPNMSAPAAITSQDANPTTCSDGHQAKKLTNEDFKKMFTKA